MKERHGVYSLPFTISGKLSDDKYIEQIRARIKGKNPFYVMHHINEHVKSIDRSTSNVRFNKTFFTASAAGCLYLTIDDLIQGNVDPGTTISAISTVMFGLISLYNRKREKAMERAKSLATDIRGVVTTGIAKWCYSKR